MKFSKVHDKVRTRADRKGWTASEMDDDSTFEVSKDDVKVVVENETSYGGARIKVYNDGMLESNSKVDNNNHVRQVVTAMMGMYDAGKDA